MEITLSRSVKLLPTLKNRAQFLALRNAPRFSCEDFILQGNLSKEIAAGEIKAVLPYIGYTVTKKIGNSVERNRIRRRLRQAIAEAVNKYLKALQDNGSIGFLKGEMVVVARTSAIDQNYNVLVSKFTKGIDRLVAKGNKAS